MRSEFIIERQGKQYALYAGLLDEAHQQGLKEIDTMILQFPSEENGHTAVCRAVVETSKGRFTGLGDAAPNNVNRQMSNCLLRMAETRAKARALRDAVNVGVACLEEYQDEETGSNGHPAPSGQQQARPAAAPDRSVSSGAQQRQPQTPKALPKEIGPAKMQVQLAMKKAGFTQPAITAAIKATDGADDAHTALQGLYDDVLSGAVKPEGK